MSFARATRVALAPTLRAAASTSRHTALRRAAPVPLLRQLHSSLPRWNQRYEDDADLNASVPVNGGRTPIGQIQQRLSVTFTCTVDQCGHRSTHEFAKRSYTHGIVIVQCPGCKNRHLIADNLSWFTETADEPKTIEQMVEAKGGTVRRGTVYSDGAEGETIEIEGADESNLK